jgi:hypothetical protein
MSDIKMERVSALWCNSREEAEKELAAGIYRMKELAGAHAAMQKDPHALSDGIKQLPAENFWRSVLLNGEIHLAKDANGWLGIHLITQIMSELWAVWEVFTPPKRRLDQAALTAAELVLSYCFAPGGLNLKKIKAYTHPDNIDMMRYLKHLGFDRRAALPDEALFNNESRTMILWELANPLLMVNQLAPQPTPKEVDDGWESDGGADGDVSVESESSSSPDGYEPVPDPWDVLQWVTDSQRGMASTANSQPANAGRSPGGRAAAPRAANYWES